MRDKSSRRDRPARDTGSTASGGAYGLPRSRTAFRRGLAGMTYEQQLAAVAPRAVQRRQTEPSPEPTHETLAETSGTNDMPVCPVAAVQLADHPEAAAESPAEQAPQAPSHVQLEVAGVPLRVPLPPGIGRQTTVALNQTVGPLSLATATLLFDEGWTLTGGTVGGHVELGMLGATARADVNLKVQRGGRVATRIEGARVQSGPLTGTATLDLDASGVTGTGQLVLVDGLVLPVGVWTVALAGASQVKATLDNSRLQRLEGAVAVSVGGITGPLAAGSFRGRIEGLDVGPGRVIGQGTLKSQGIVIGGPALQASLAPGLDVRLKLGEAGERQFDLSGLDFALTSGSRTLATAKSRRASWDGVSFDGDVAVTLDPNLDARLGPLHVKVVSNGNIGMGFDSEAGISLDGAGLAVSVAWESKPFGTLRWPKWVLRLGGILGDLGDLFGRFFQSLPEVDLRFPDVLGWLEGLVPPGWPSWLTGLWPKLTGFAANLGDLFGDLLDWLSLSIPSFGGSGKLGALFGALLDWLAARLAGIRLGPLSFPQMGGLLSHIPLFAWLGSLRFGGGGLQLGLETSGQLSTELHGLAALPSVLGSDLAATLTRAGVPLARIVVESLRFDGLTQLFSARVRIAGGGEVSVPVGERRLVLGVDGALEILVGPDQPLELGIPGLSARLMEGDRELAAGRLSGRYSESGLTGTAALSTGADFVAAKGANDAWALTIAGGTAVSVTAGTDGSVSASLSGGASFERKGKTVGSAGAILQMQGDGVSGLVTLNVPDGVGLAGQEGSRWKLLSRGMQLTALLQRSDLESLAFMGGAALCENGEPKASAIVPGLVVPVDGPPSGVAMVTLDKEWEQKVGSEAALVVAGGSAASIEIEAGEVTRLGGNVTATVKDKEGELAKGSLTDVSCALTADGPVFSGNAALSLARDLEPLGAGMVTIGAGGSIGAFVADNRVVDATASGLVLTLDVLEGAQLDLSLLHLVQAVGGAFQISGLANLAAPLTLFDGRFDLSALNLQLGERGKIMAAGGGLFRLVRGIVAGATLALETVNGVLKPLIGIQGEVVAPLSEEETLFKKGKRDESDDSKPWKLLNLKAPLPLGAHLRASVDAFIELGVAPLTLKANLDVQPFDPTTGDLPTVEADAEVAGDAFAQAGLLLSAQAGFGDGDVAVGLGVDSTAAAQPQASLEARGRLVFGPQGLEGAVDLDVDLTGKVAAEAALKFYAMLGTLFDPDLFEETLGSEHIEVPGLFNWLTQLTLPFAVPAGVSTAASTPLLEIGPSEQNVAEQAYQAATGAPQSAPESQDVARASLPGGGTMENLKKGLQSVQLFASMIDAFTSMYGLISTIIIPTPGDLYELVFEGKPDPMEVINKVMAFSEAAEKAEKEGTLKWLEEKLPDWLDWIVDMLREYVKLVNALAGPSTAQMAESAEPVQTYTTKCYVAIGQLADVVKRHLGYVPVELVLAQAFWHEAAIPTWQDVGGITVGYEAIGAAPHQHMKPWDWARKYQDLRVRWAMDKNGPLLQWFHSYMPGAPDP